MCRVPKVVHRHRVSSGPDSDNVAIVGTELNAANVVTERQRDGGIASVRGPDLHARVVGARDEERVLAGGEVHGPHPFRVAVERSQLLSCGDVPEHDAAFRRTRVEQVLFRALTPRQRADS